MTEASAGPARDWLVIIGLTITALAAAVSSYTGLRALAVAAGFPVSLAWMFPLCIDAYALTSTRVWLASTTRSRRVRRFAAWNASGAIVLSLVGNGLWHLLDAGLLTVNWAVVLFTAAVPPLVLGAASHLIGLRHQVDPVLLPAMDQGQLPPSTNPRRSRRGGSGQRGPRARTEDDLIVAARSVSAVWRADHGRPISRDELRKALHVSSQRATQLLRQLKQEQLSSRDVVNSTDDKSSTIRDN